METRLILRNPERKSWQPKYAQKYSNLCLKDFLKVSNDGEFLIEMVGEFHVSGATMERVWFEAVWKLRIVLCSKSLEALSGDLVELGRKDVALIYTKAQVCGYTCTHTPAKILQVIRSPTGSQVKYGDNVFHQSAINKVCHPVLAGYSGVFVSLCKWNHIWVALP